MTLNVFDRYFPNSIKISRGLTRMQITGSSRAHKLTPDMPALAKQQVLTNTKNKIQLNAMLAEGLLDSHFYNTAEAHRDIAADLLATYGLPGADTRHKQGNCSKGFLD